MKFENYAVQIGNRLREAYNEKNAAAVYEMFGEANSSLGESDISPDGKQRFWALVQEAFFSAPLLMEKQEGGALHQLLKDIEARLAAGQGAKGS
jgi:hypothetical protein